jgi:hypothetical protein
MEQAGRGWERGLTYLAVAVASLEGDDLGARTLKGVRLRGASAGKRHQRLSLLKSQGDPDMARMTRAWGKQLHLGQATRQ